KKRRAGRDAAACRGRARHAMVAGPERADSIRGIMSDTIRCPDCGHVNPAGSASCANCNFPLTAPAAEPASHAPEPEGAAGPLAIPRPACRRRPRPGAMPPQAISIYLMVAIVIAVAVLLVAVRGFHQSNFAPVEGAKEEQQKSADEYRAALAKDSSNVEAHIGLANVMYDTGNWSEAIIHYRAALARDSSRATTLVDLGVCYYNLSEPDQAEKLFQLALARDPHQPVALFNLGMVAERRGDNQTAIKYLHRALVSDPPENMRQPLIDAMTRVQKALGITAPPI